MTGHMFQRKASYLLKAREQKERERERERMDEWKVWGFSIFFLSPSFH
jgi:hypothetical protein